MKETKIQRKDHENVRPVSGKHHGRVGERMVDGNHRIQNKGPLNLSTVASNGTVTSDYYLYNYLVKRSRAIVAAARATCCRRLYHIPLASVEYINFNSFHGKSIFQFCCAIHFWNQAVNTLWYCGCPRHVCCRALFVHPRL